MPFEKRTNKLSYIKICPESGSNLGWRVIMIFKGCLSGICSKAEVHVLYWVCSFDSFALLSELRFRYGRSVCVWLFNYIYTRLDKRMKNDIIFFKNINLGESGQTIFLAVHVHCI